MIRRVDAPHGIGDTQAAPALREQFMAALMADKRFIRVIPLTGMREIQTFAFKNLNGAAKGKNSIEFPRADSRCVGQLASPLRGMVKIELYHGAQMYSRQA